MAGIGDALYWRSNGKPATRGGVPGSAAGNQVRLRTHDQHNLTRRLHLPPRHGLGVGHFVTRGLSVRRAQKRFQNNSRFAAQVSRDPLGSHLNMMRKFLYIGFILVAVLVAVFLLLEPPREDYFAFAFSDSLEPQFRLAGLDCYTSMPTSERDSIFVALLGDLDSVYISTTLRQNVGLTGERPRGREIVFDTSSVHAVSRRWKQLNFKSQFLDSHPTAHEGFAWVTLSPIKRIGSELYIGIEQYRGPLAAWGLIYRITRSGNRFVFKEATLGWIS